MKMQKKTKRNHSFIISFCIVALGIYFVISLVAVNRQIKKTESEIAQVGEQLAVQNAENKKLQGYIDNGDMNGYIEEIARDDLGYVMPGDRAYFDVSVND